MAGGLSIAVQQGSVSANTGQAALVGSAIAVSQGTVAAQAVALTGSESTSAAGTAVPLMQIRLQSKKTVIGGQSASQALTGRSIAVSQGSLVSGKTFPITGVSATFSQGTILYRGQVTISWTPNTESDLSGYRIYHGTTSGVYTETITLASGPGSSISYIWTGLLPGFTHYFAVTAFDTNGNESNKSAEVAKVF